MVTRPALLALLLAWQLNPASAAAASCAQSVQQFSTVHGNAVSPHPDAQLMLYSLHIPRTAGRTYHSCFLKLGSPPSRRCETSYDVLRIDRRLEGCGLLSSHDALSTSTLLPANAAFATQIRWAAAAHACMQHGRACPAMHHWAGVHACESLSCYSMARPVMQGPCGQGDQRIRVQH